MVSNTSEVSESKLSSYNYELSDVEVQKNIVDERGEYKVGTDST